MRLFRDNKTSVFKFQLMGINTLEIKLFFELVRCGEGEKGLHMVTMCQWHTVQYVCNGPNPTRTLPLEHWKLKRLREKEKGQRKGETGFKRGMECKTFGQTLKETGMK